MEIDKSATQARISVALTTAEKAERDAADRSNAARKRVRDADAEAEKEVDHIRDVYEKRAATERVRGENYVETVKSRTYENLAEVRRKNDAEEARLARQNKKNLHDTDEHYQRQVTDLVHHGDAKVKDLTKQNHSMEQALRRQGENAREELKSGFEMERSALHSRQEQLTDQARKSTETAVASARERSREAVERSNEHYQETYEGALKQSRDAINDLNWRAARGIDDVRRETQTKLDAYSSQKNDPFYRMVDLGAELRENEDHFVLTATIPEHERDGVTVNIQGERLMVSGKRKSEEKLEIEPGRTQRTSAYQTYSESFPLNWPVDSKFMTREWDGDQLVVRIPKRATYLPPKPKREVERAVAERPKFPKSLPTEAQLAAKNAEPPENDSTPPSKRKKSGSVLG
jgi:HSP20 family molecular chaperone IbpA